MASSKQKVKVICEVCKGNGFVRVPYELSREELWADCDFCNNQGEIEKEVEDDVDRQKKPN
jgi:DnaJ-class molecular chaperone